MSLNVHNTNILQSPKTGMHTPHRINKVTLNDWLFIECLSNKPLNVQSTRMYLASPKQLFFDGANYQEQTY